MHPSTSSSFEYTRLEFHSISAMAMSKQEASSIYADMSVLNSKSRKATYRDLFDQVVVIISHTYKQPCILRKV